MGFENRKSLRVALESQVYFWLGDQATGSGIWGQTLNLSATGLALRCGRALDKDARVVMELSLPGLGKALHVTAKVVHCALEGAFEKPYHVRIVYEDLDPDVRQSIRLYVLQVAEPGSGWGRAYFEGRPPIDLKYKELAASDRVEWLEKKLFLSMKEIGYLKKYQALLEDRLGSKAPESFKLLGSRPLKEQCDVWMELDMPSGQLHFIGKTLWCTHEKGEKAQCGVALVAFHKDEAMKVEKAGPGPV